MIGNALLSAALLAQGAAPDAETRIVKYLEEHVKPGERVVVSQLVNEVFTSDEERAVLNRLFNTFFKIPLYVAQFHQSAQRPPSLVELSEQFHFRVPGEAAVMLRIMESDPRMPPFLERDPDSGEITEVDTDAILQHSRFGKLLERSLAGWVGTPAPPLALEGFDGAPIGSEQLAGKPHLVYFWFTGCPPCVKSTPLLVELYQQYAPRGFEIVGVSADRVLELPYTDADRAAYAEEKGIRFPLAHATEAVLGAWGAVSVYPTLFFVDAKGVIVSHGVNFQDKAALVAAVEKALE